jgi:omega-6 fatty acid desaturase (delta-12 desaturase)
MTPEATHGSVEAPLAPPVPVTTVTLGTRRPEKELLGATRPFIAESMPKSWSYLGSTMLVLAGLLTGAVLAPFVALKLVFSLVAGLTVVRMFCLFHDYYHGAFLRQSKLADGIFTLFGFAILVPPSVWKETHNYHHAHTAKIVGSHIGSYPVVTVAMWKTMSGAQKTLYKAVRHPLNMFFALFTVFFVGMCIRPFLRAPKKHLGGLLAIVMVAAMSAALIGTGHLEAWVYGWLIPAWVATMAGAYLFYAQHNFPDAIIADRQSWTFANAALDSSSYFKMSLVMHWFTANIGYHHVHHLNAAIPFYRLPEAMAQVPELQHPGETSWAPSEILKNFRLKLWDTEQNVMVGYPD